MVWLLHWSLSMTFREWRTLRQKSVSYYSQLGSRYILHILHKPTFTIRLLIQWTSSELQSVMSYCYIRCVLWKPKGRQLMYRVHDPPLELNCTCHLSSAPMPELHGSVGKSIWPAEDTVFSPKSFSLCWYLELSFNWPKFIYWMCRVTIKFKIIFTL